MIVLNASGIDELNMIWKRLRNDFQVIESIHLDPTSLQYRMVINQPELTKMLRGVADKVLDRIDLYEDDSLDGTITLKQFNSRIEDKQEKYPSIEPLSKIWEVISETDKKAIFAYLRRELGGSSRENLEEEYVLD
ncbi:MAG: hypothetical protein GY816_17925 [Cytophagales bacterium]|nr:hypothetical protein [Cytophagales bacterium]